MVPVILCVTRGVALAKKVNSRNIAGPVCHVCASAEKKEDVAGIVRVMLTDIYLAS